MHGFFLDESSVGYRVLWPMTLLAVGVTACSAWVLTGFLVSKSADKVKKWILFAALVFCIYAVVVMFYSQRFIVVILNYLPAMIALLIASVHQYTRMRSSPFLLISGGILVSFVAAFIQQAGLGIHPTYFNHNSTYHLVQAVGLLILFKGATGLLSNERVIS